jgi:hypothetical protein
MVLATLFFGAVMPAMGEPQLGKYRALGGAANVVCGHFASEMDKGPAADLMLGVTVISWVHGYLTAYNETLSKSPEVAGDLSRGLTDTDVVSWIADYCSDHPNERIRPQTK